MMSVLINGLFVVMLAVMMLYGVVITRRVRKLMAVLAEMEPLVREFSAAVDKTEQSVSRIRTAARDLAGEPAAAPDSRAEPGLAVTFTSRRHQPVANPIAGPIAGPIPGPIAGMTRVTGKADLVKSFFERGRMQGDMVQQW